MRQFFILLLICFLFGDQPTIPEFYYYSYADKAFMIERADGSYSEVLAEFEFSGDTIEGPGWSPSGEWFTWTVTSSPDEKALAMIVSRNTKEVRNLLDVEGEVLDLDWSPIADLLLIRFQNYQVGIQSVVVDIETQNTILHTEEDSKVEWVTSGNYLVLYHQIETHYEMKIFSSNGVEVGVREIILPNGLRETSHSCFPQWSPDDAVVYIDASTNTLTVENMTSGEKQTLEITRWMGAIFDCLLTGMLLSIDNLTVVYLQSRSFIFTMAN